MLNVRLNTRYPLAQKKVTIIGMGMTGLSCLTYVQKQGAKVTIIDTRTAPAGVEAINALNPHQLHVGVDLTDTALRADILASDYVVVSPGIDLRHPLFAAIKSANIPLLSEIELFADAVDTDKPVYAVTGSNGKSTVVKLLTDILRAAGHQPALGGNYGIPALDLLVTDADCYVLELSSFQLETTTHLSCAVACILNISEDHIDRHGDMSAYIEAKQRIYAHAKKAVVNAEDVQTLPCHAGLLVKRFAQSASVEVNAYLQEEADGYRFVVDYDTEVSVLSSQLAIQGLHNYGNILACLLMLKDVLSVSVLSPEKVNAVENAIITFSGLAYRCEFVAESAGVRWINDSKGTNVGATVAAISGLAQGDNIILLAGGVGKGADFSPLIAVNGLKHVIVFGQDAVHIQTALTRSTVQSVSVTQVENLGEAVALADNLAQHGDTVLLSPACASFDQYDNYQARGEHFNALVAEIITAKTPQEEEQ